MSAALVAPNALSTEETSRLELLEGTIKRGIKIFVEVGLALAEIRDSRLYRATHATFEAYCQDRFGFSRQRAHQLITGAAVVKSLSTAVDRLPERAVRLLSSVPKERRQAVYDKAVEVAASGGREVVTTSDIGAAVYAVTNNVFTTDPIKNAMVVDAIPETSTEDAPVQDLDKLRTYYYKSRKREDEASAVTERLVDSVTNLVTIAEDVDLAAVDPRLRAEWGVELESAANALAHFARRLRS